jgi:hypothetical protein
MTTTQSLRDATVILTDSSNWISWYRQLKIKCQSQDTWPLADLEGIQTQRTRPEPPLPPEITQYKPSVNGSTTSTALSHTVRAGRSSARRTTHEAIETAITAPQTPPIPTQVLDLSNKGQEAYKEDREDYKLQLESYKIYEKEYQDKKSKISKTVEHILTTVTPHLQLSCCAENRTLRD